MKLGLGTVQFGLPYGIANTSGKVTEEEVASILALAREHGVDTLDTAIAYGTAEAVLGRAGVSGFRVVTKLPPLDTSNVRPMLEGSLERLGGSRLHGLLLHRSSDLTKGGMNDLYDNLIQIRDEGLVERIGVSIYTPAELDMLFSRFPLDIVQAPFNVLDRRLETSGWLSRLNNAGVQVHTRSAFLQGALLMPIEQQLAHFPSHAGIWKLWNDWLKEAGMSASEAALSFVLGNDNIHRVIVGVDTAEQWLQLVSISGDRPKPPGRLAIDDEEILNPASWKQN